MNNQVTTVGTGVVSGTNYEWKKVPGFPNVYASSLGQIGIMSPKMRLRIVRGFEQKTTKGTYWYSRVYDDSGEGVKKAHHQLVTLAFHGFPPSDGKKYEPNHINGDKHNNRPDNLEWMTRSQNVQHAFDSGLCISGLRVYATNVLTGEEKTFNSFSATARAWGIPRKRFTDIVANHRVIPYLGQWVFSVDDSSDKKLNRYQRTNLIYKDYRDGKIVICNDSFDAASLTGVKSGTIQARTAKTGNNYKDKYTIVNGYVFKVVKDETPWPEYTKEQIAQSIEIYKIGGKLGQKQCFMKNYLTGEITKHKSISEAAKSVHSALGVIRAFSSMFTKLVKNKSLALYKGRVIKSIDDERSWPEYTNDQISRSIV
jgi:hypothetical protein